LLIAKLAAVYKLGICSCWG